MKRFLALLLSALLALSLAACGSEKKGEKETTAAATTAEAGKTQTEENSTAPEKSDTMDIPEIERGVITDDTYESAFTGLSFKKGNTWDFADDKTLAELTSSAIDALSLDSFGESLTKSATLYDMMATDSVTNANIIVGYENLSITNGGPLTEEEYFANVKLMLSGYKTGEVEKTNLGDEVYSSMVVEATFGETTVKQRYCIKAYDEFMSIVVMTENGTVTTDDMIKMFY